jgi:hypothetical protein
METCFFISRLLEKVKGNSPFDPPKSTSTVMKNLDDEQQMIRKQKKPREPPPSRCFIPHRQDSFSVRLRQAKIGGYLSRRHYFCVVPHSRGETFWPNRW